MKRHVEELIDKIEKIEKLCKKGIKLKVSWWIFLQPKNARVLYVIQLGNVKPGDHSPWMR